MTSAMELVSATKMRRAQEVALASRAYAFTALELLADISQQLENSRLEDLGLPLLQKHLNTRTALVLVAADKGLAGAFNSNVFRKLERFLEDTPGEYTYISVGQKASDYLKRQGKNIAFEFVHYGDVIRLEETAVLANVLEDGYRDGRWDVAIVFSTHFMSTLKQEVVEQQLLPLDFQKIRRTVDATLPETGKYAEFRHSIEDARPPEVTAPFCLVPSPEFSQAPWYSLPDHLCRFRARSLYT